MRGVTCLVPHWNPWEGSQFQHNIHFQDSEEEQEIETKRFADVENPEGSEEQSGSEEGTTPVAACPGVSRDLQVPPPKRPQGYHQWDTFHRLGGLPKDIPNHQFSIFMVFSTVFLGAFSQSKKTLTLRGFRDEGEDRSWLVIWNIFFFSLSLYIYIYHIHIGNVIIPIDFHSYFSQG